MNKEQDFAIATLGMLIAFIEDADINKKTIKPRIFQRYTTEILRSTWLYGAWYLQPATSRFKGVGLMFNWKLTLWLRLSLQNSLFKASIQ